MRWQDTEEIVQLLEEHYPDEDIPEDDLQYLEEMVRNMEEFEEHDTVPSKDNLKHLIEAWLELRSSY